MCYDMDELEDPVLSEVIWPPKGQTLCDSAYKRDPEKQIHRDRTSGCQGLQGQERGVSV